MKIAYGVHGYGRGHSSRALAVLPMLAARHDVLVLAGGDAYDALAADYRVVRIATMRYTLTKSGRRSGWRTVLGALPHLLDLGVRGPGLQVVCETLEDFAPDVVVSDSESQTHWAARRMGIPRISFDHFAVLVHCHWPMTFGQRIINRAESVIYRHMMAAPAERYVVASFYPARPAGDSICVVGPVLRDSVRQTTPRDDGFLLVYLSNGNRHFTPRFREALTRQDTPVVIYGTGRDGDDANLQFRPPSNTQFVADLSACRAVLATAGNQLISEAMSFRKPLLLVPEDSLEQRLNATAVAEMGIGQAAARKKLSADLIRNFLDAHDDYAAHFANGLTEADGRKDAVAAIERFATELRAQRQGPVRSL